MTITSATSAAPLPFAAHIDAPMPRGLRQEADTMSFEAFHDEYASSSGPLRLGNWECTDTARSSPRLGPQAPNYHAPLAPANPLTPPTAPPPEPLPPPPPT